LGILRPDAIREDAIGTMILVAIHDRVHVAGAAAADKQHPLRAERHRPRVLHAGSVDVDGETGRELDGGQPRVLLA
jgi:hypothetical protein